MKNYTRKTIVELIGFIMIMFGLGFAMAQAQTVSYYPHAVPTAWYVLPGGSLGWSGDSFVPHETVQISDVNGAIYGTAITNGNGSFSAPNVLMIPYSWKNSTHEFIVQGLTSGAQVVTTIYIGAYFPQIKPNGWWLSNGQSFTIFGTGFAPGEAVQLSINSTLVDTVAADQNGDVTFSANAPLFGTQGILTATGTLSGASNTQTVSLYGSTSFSSGSSGQSTSTATSTDNNGSSNNASSTIVMVNGYPTLNGNYIDCDGTVDNDPAHHTTDPTDTDPAHHRGQNCAADSFVGMNSTQQTVAYCQADGPMGYNVYTSNSSYASGTPIEFCLQDNTRSPLFVGPDEHPWEITDGSGNVIYTPSSTAPTMQPPSTFTFFDSWNGATNANNQSGSASAGTYHVIFPGFPGTPSATFNLH